MTQFYELHVDESNPVFAEGKFFVAGGLILTPSQEVELHKRIEQIRVDWELGDAHLIKYRMKSSPTLSSMDIKSIKSEVIDAVVDAGGVVIIYTVLHDITRSDSVDQRTTKGIEQIVDVYSKRFLADREAYGSVCLDRRDGSAPFTDVERIFRKGRHTGTWPHRQFDRVIHTSLTTSKCSHLNSALDVVLGSIQYCINLDPTERSWEIARALYPRINQLLYRRDDGIGRKVIRGNGFLISPQTVTVPRYRAKYEGLTQNLNALLR